MKKYFIDRSRIISALLILALLIGTSLSACKREEVSGEADGVSFKDALGREVTVKTKPQRVAALIGSFADVWVLSGGSLCAAAEDAFEDFGVELGETVNLGGAHSPSLELLLSSDPELVLASASTASNVEMETVLEAAGITVAYFDVDNFEDYLEMLDICTDITCRKDLYEVNGTRIKAEIEEIKAEYMNDGISEKEKTVLLLRASSTSVKAKGSRGTVLGEMLDDMGCINIADSDKSLLEDLSVESVISQEPHHIFVVTMGNDSAAAERSLSALMNENAAWATLEAVRSGRLHIMDKTLFNLKPNERWAEAYGKLYETLKK
ncbi:MAG: ABC transporter substrate-binding protein [Ruminococcaceae bacterium]|nr:ABC transporter substrate-binding protein [Oscillospiraceae bacterium]